MTRTRRGAALLSWSGTLFEYLLPSLFLKSPRGTLLGETCRQAAREQVGAFGGGRGAFRNRAIMPLTRS